MTDLSSQSSTYFHRVVLHAIIVLSIGLIAGLMLAFSLLDAVNSGPTGMGSVHTGFKPRLGAAHVGGILNGIMLIVLINLAKTRLIRTRLSPQRMVADHHRLG